MLSVILPGIRVGNWESLYDSIVDAYSGDWELIIISPYGLPSGLSGKENIKLISSRRSPLSCQQIGLLECSGDYITWSSDDGVFLPNSLDRSMELSNKDTVVIHKYLEGENKVNPSKADDHLGFASSYNLMSSDKYYSLDFHIKSTYKYVPKGAYVMSFGMIPKGIMLDVGGWDCRFEVCPMAFNDLSIRLLKYGAKFSLQKDIVQICKHMPDVTGDHAPIHYAHIENDDAEFKKIYDSPDSVERVKIPIDTYKDTDEVWRRRFA